MKRLSFALALVLAMPLFGQRASDLTSNSIKYKDTGIPNAQGRSGSAAIEARALLGADGVTDVELTTGSFDDGNTAGSIDKVQVKANFDSEDAITRNFTTSGGTTSVRLDTLPLAWHQPVRISANVSGIDPSRTDVVTAQDTVKRRPDLAIDRVYFPGQVIANHPASFFASIRENNRDIGARADCVLHVDGEAVDRAIGIWVDAGDSVMCMMAYPLAQLGPHQLQITIENVNPGDWNPANNASPVSTVNVRSAADVVAGGSYHATATETTTESESYTPGDETQSYWQSQYTHNVERQGWTILEASVPYAFDPTTIHGSLAEWTDNEWLNNLEGGSDGYFPSGYGCYDLRYGRTWTWSACTSEGLTTFFYWRGTTVARYYSRWWGMFTDYYTGDKHYFDHDMDRGYTFAPREAYGDTASLEMIISDANHSWQIDPVMTMVPWTDPEQHNDGCYGDPAHPTCYTGTLNRSGKDGEDTEAND